MSTCRWLLVPVFYFLMASIYCQPTSTAYSSSDLALVFDSTNHAKAHGAQVRVSYPARWIAREGRGDKVIQNFSGQHAGIPTVLSLAIQTYEGSLEKECARASPQQWLDGASSPGWVVSRLQTFNRRGKPAVMVEIYKNSRVDGFDVWSEMQTMLVCHKRHMIKMSCVVSGASHELAKSNMDKIHQLCVAYLDGLVIK